MIRLWKFKVKKSEFHIQTDDILYVKKAIFIDQNLSLASQPYNFCGNLAIYVDIYWAFFKYLGAILVLFLCWFFETILDTINLFTTSESPKYLNLPIFCCLQNFVFFLIKSRVKYWNHTTFSNPDSMGVQYVIQQNY